MLIQHPHSVKLINCLKALEIATDKAGAKMELISITNGLMPAGLPDFLGMIKYPRIVDMIPEHGKPNLIKLVFLLIKDFCGSVNVVRNMNEDQMIEAASILIEEAGNFRIEDYTMMFAMGKRGDLVKIMDRIDISVISAMADEYFSRRRDAADNLRDGYTNRLDNIGTSNRAIDSINPEDRKLIEKFDDIAAEMEAWKMGVDMKSKPLTEKQARSQIHKPDVSYQVKKDPQGKEYITTKKNRHGK